MRVAVVAVVDPLAVRLRGSGVDTPVQRAACIPPDDLAVGDRVVVTIVEQQLTLLGPWERIDVHDDDDEGTRNEHPSGRARRSR